jgi:FMN phosphatase YigB (HAD superfamily)
MLFDPTVTAATLMMVTVAVAPSGLYATDSFHCSKQPEEPAGRQVSRTGLGRYIDVVQTSDQLGVAKPDPRAFELACVHLGVPTRAAVYIGDQLEVDALAATAAGLHGIWLNRNGGAVPPGVETVDNLTDLPSLLEELRLI